MFVLYLFLFMAHSTFFTESISFLHISLKTMHRRKLHYSLGHPNNSLQLEALCQEEIKRQKDQTDGVHLNTKMLQVIVKPLPNVNLNVACGKKGVFWICFSSPSKGNLNFFFSFRQSCSYIAKLWSDVLSALEQYGHKYICTHTGA